MFNKIDRANLFVRVFNFGLILLFAGLFREYFFAPAPIFYFRIGIASFFAAGVSICLISLIFLLAEWITIPFGTLNKRHTLCLGAGKLFALALLGAAYLLIAEQSPRNFAGVLSFSLGSFAMIIAAVFTFLGKPIANRLCCKKITSKTLIARDLSNGSSAATNLNNNGGNARPLKIRNFTTAAR